MSSSRSSSIKPSKSPSIPQTARSPRSPAVPHFEDPPDEPPEQDPPFTAEAEHEHEIPYPDPGSEQTLLPPPNFNPFFSLIEDTTSREHYHPFVHYVFADDDPVIVTAAAMRSLGLDDTKYLPQHTPDGEDDRREMDTGSEQRHNAQVESPLPPQIPGIKERYMIIDVAADGHTIIDAQSLSSDWQITGANVRTAPSFDEESPDHSYMLKVEGVEVPLVKSRGKAKGGPGGNKLDEAREKAQGDIFTALDEIIKGIEGGLEITAKIGGTAKEDVRESERTVVGPTSSVPSDAKSKSRVMEASDS